ncbi:MAG: Inorganic triphosphatase YgiF, contains and domain [Mycobacterium sp.]|nr:Inorganic triphosphatase YgiF, contains and domain [Mycobacterium sp.]
MVDSTPVTTAREQERKYSVHGLFVMPELIDPSVGLVSSQPRPAQTLRAVYYDSTDLRLARDGITLRHRSGDGPARWTLKLPAGDSSESGLVRDEIEVIGSGREIPAELSELLTGWLRGTAIAPVATLRTSRSIQMLCGEADEELLEVVDDTVSVQEGRRVVSRFREIEVEVKGELAPLALTAVANRLATAGAVPGDQLPKVVRALGPRAVAPPELPPAGKVLSSDPASELVAASLRTGTRRLLLADIGVRRHEEDAVHQMRVACRRMRSDLKTFRPLVEPLWGEALRTELSWLAGSLGDARDLEVLRERLRKMVTGQVPSYDLTAFERLDAILVTREAAALTASAEALQSDRYLRLLSVLVDAAREPVVSEAASASCSKVLPPLVRGAWDRMAKSARKLEAAGEDDQWHEARIKAKQARYAAEAVTDVLGKPAARMAAGAKAVQEVLGDHQDAAIAADVLLALAADHLDDAGLCLVAGRLIQANRCAVADSRREFPAAWNSARKAVG